MTCEHLRELEQALIDAGMKEIYRGRAWSESREWVYFDCILDLQETRTGFDLPAFVKDHVHRGTHDGTEQGFYCEKCRDGIMGRHPEAFPSDIRFP